MNTILILSPEQAHFDMFTAHYGHLPIHFSWARNLDQAVKYIDLEKPTSVFLLASHIESLAEWIETLKNNSPDIPFVCFSGALDWVDREMLWKSGARDVIRLPLGRKEMEFILRSITIKPKGSETDVSKGIRGSLADFGVIDLIRTFETSGRSGTLYLINGAQNGQIEFDKGKVVNAEYLSCDPLEAVTVMSAWGQGQVYSRFDKHKRRRKIMLENAQVILECRNYQKMRAEMLRKLPPANKKIFTAPNLAFEEFGPNDREWLQKFSNGYSLDQAQAEFSGNLNFLLKKFLFWYEHHWLMDEETYHLQQAKLLAEKRRSIFRRIMGRIFSSKKEANEEVLAVSEELEEDDVLLEAVKKPYHFNRLELLASFRQALEEPK